MGGRVIRRVRQSTEPPVDLGPSRDIQALRCRRCGKPIAVVSGGKMKLAVASKVLTFADGVASMNCPHCHESTEIPEVRLSFGCKTTPAGA